MSDEMVLSCVYCDTDDGLPLRTVAEAVAAGWFDVAEDDGPAWTHLGICPECEPTMGSSEKDSL